MFLYLLFKNIHECALKLYIVIVCVVVDVCGVFSLTCVLSKDADLLCREKLSVGCVTVVLSKLLKSAKFS